MFSFIHMWLYSHCNNNVADMNSPGGILLQKCSHPRDGPVILEQRYRSWLLIRVKMLVKQSKLIEKPATTNNDFVSDGHWWTGKALDVNNCAILVAKISNKNSNSLITTFREIHKYPWALSPGREPGEIAKIRETWRVCRSPYRTAL